MVMGLKIANKEILVILKFLKTIFAPLILSTVRIQNSWSSPSSSPSLKSQPSTISNFPVTRLRPKLAQNIFRQSTNSEIGTSYGSSEDSKSLDLGQSNKTDTLS
jgi:hypothetical protein